jgi:hypothetical protein
MCTTNTENITITIEDLNDNGPLVPSTQENISIPENHVGSIFNITWTDGDSSANSNVTLILNSTSVNIPFGLNGHQVVVTDPSGIDYESIPHSGTNPDYTLYIYLINPPSDPNDQTLYTVITLYIFIQDINDITPVIFPPFQFSINENEPMNTLVGKVNATDGEEGENGRLTYTSSSSNISSSCNGISTFRLNTSDGTIHTCDSLDYESGPTTYSFIIEVCDNGMTQLCNDESFTINVIDVNDNPLTFINTPYEGSVRETEPNNFTVLSVSVMDADSQPYTVTFELLESNIPFCINGSGDVIVCNSTQLTSYETEGIVFHLTVRAIQVSDTNEVLSNITAPITINLILINEFQPEFILPIPPFNSILKEQFGDCSVIDPDLSEDGDVIFTLHIVDGDGGVSGNVDYTIDINPDGPFNFSKTSGVLEVSGCVDADIGTMYTVTVNATDGIDVDGTEYSIKSTDFNIFIRDFNDNPPEVLGPFVFNVREDETEGRFVFGHIMAQDADITSVNYNTIIENPDISGDAGVCDTEIAVVDGAAGRINTADLYFCSAVDFDDPSAIKTYSLSLIAENPDGITKGIYEFKNTVNFNVIVNVVDNNEHRPVIHDSSFMFSIDEGLDNNTFIDNIPASDSDASYGPGGMLKYFLSKFNVPNIDESCTSQIPFYVTSNGNLYTCDILDYEETQSYFFYVSVCDMGNIVMCTTNTENITITIEDLNDNGPLVPSTQENISIPENHVGSIFNITWTDGDSSANSNVTLILNSTSVNIPFGLNGHQVVVTDPSGIDYESIPHSGTNPDYTLYIYLINPPSDPNDQTLYTVITLYIFIQDINDITPVIFPPFQFSINENEPMNTLVGKVNATDGEEGENGRLTYTSSSSNISSSCNGISTFRLNTSDGTIHTCDSLDYESGPTTYSFIIEVCDNGMTQLCNDESFTINVIDLNDNPPVFPPGIIELEIYENLAVNSGVYFISTTDEDSPNNSIVSYSFVNTTSPFAIRNSNEIYYTGVVPLDYESDDKFFMLHLRATNPPSVIGGDTTIHVVDVVIVIELIDRNDNPPVFSNDSDAASIVEHSMTNFVLYFLQTSDRDTANNSFVYYQIVTHDTPFSIINNSVVVSDSDSLDREQLTSNYPILIEAVNLPGRPDDETQFANFTLNIEIEDINDNTPEFYGKKIFLVQESFSIGYALPEKVLARDYDEGLNGMIRFTIENSIACSCSSSSSCVSTNDIFGSGSGVGDMICTLTSPFEIDQDGGRLTICHALDFEEYCMYVLDVMACDFGDRCNRTNITVNVMDVNDNHPFITGPFFFVVNETVSEGHEVGCVNATDIDTGVGGVLHFYSDGVDECTSGFPFQVINSTGCIRVCSNSLNYENSTFYRFDMRVADAGDPILDNTTTITIFVRNINDHGPVITSPPFADVNENEIDAFVIQVNATDIDHHPFNMLSYNLSDDAGGRFTMDSNRRVYTAVKLDREVQSYYLIQLEVTDGVFTTHQTINITINDVNDERPYYAGPASISVRENEFFSIDLYFEDDDAAGTVNSEVVLYNVSGDFTFKPNTLILNNTRTFDRDTETGGSPNVSANVLAIDKGNPPELSDPVQITFVLIDENDNAPIPLKPFTAPVRDDTGPNVYIATLNATDYDEGANAEIEFELLNHNSMFYINKSTGELYTNAVINLGGATIQDITLTILISDKGLPSLNTTYNFTVSIFDNLPIFRTSTYTFNVTENNLSSVIGRVSAIDRDAETDEQDSDFVYSILGVCPSGNFTMINNSIISPSSYLDHEDDNTFELIVGVGINTVMFSDTATVTVIVNDMNDNAPILSPVNVSVFLPENRPVGYVVTKLVAIDFDSANSNAGRVSYSLLDGVGKDLFYIDSEGNLKTNSTEASNFEVYPSFTFTYRACDHGDPSLCSDTGVIFITAQDVDDIPPEFLQDSYSRSINESLPPDVSILTVNFRDNDTQLTDLTLTLVPPQTQFKIEQMTGILRTTDVPLDYEEQSVHTFYVVVTDPASQFDAATITITLLDIDDNKPSIISSSPDNTFMFNEGQIQPINLNLLDINEPDTVSQNTMDRVTLRLKSSPSASALSYPLEGGFCDHLNSTTIDNSSYSLCYVTSCVDLREYLQPLSGVNDLNNIYYFDHSRTNSLARTSGISASILSLEDNFSITFWTKVDSIVTGQDFGHLFSMEQTTSVLFRVVVDRSFNIQIASGSNQNIVSTSGISISDGSPHHIAIVRYGSHMSIFVDGVLYGNSSNAGSIITGGNNDRSIFIGQYLTAYISQMTFCSNRSLTSDEIKCLVSCGELLDASSTQNITATVNFASRTVNLGCNVPNSCSLAEMNTALDGVSYTNAIDEPNPEPRGLFASAKDAVGFGPESVFSITPNLTNDKSPVLDLNGLSTPGINYQSQYIELSDPTPIVGSDVVLYDLDSGFWKFNRIVVELADPLVNNESLTFSERDLPSGIEIVNTTAPLGLIVRSSSSQDVLPDPLVNSLKAIRYHNNLANPINTIRNISFTVYDFESVNTNSPLAVSTLTIQLANDPPVLSIGASSVNFNEQERTLTLLQSVSVSIDDPDSADLSQAILTLQNTVNGNDESLNLTSTIPGISSSYNYSTGILTISGVASRSSYVNLLKSVVYANNNSHPTTAPRQVSIQVVDDRNAHSNVKTISITVSPYNDPPSLTFDSTGTNINYVNFTEDEDVCVQVIPVSGFTLSDPEDAGLSYISIEISRSVSDTDYFKPTGVVVTGSYTVASFHANKKITIFTSNINVNYADVLTLFEYCDSSGEPTGGPRMITITMYDNHVPGTSVASFDAFTYVNILNVNDPPQLYLEAAQGLSYGGEPVPFVSPFNNTLTDNDDTLFTGFRVTITNPQDSAADEVIQTLGKIPNSGFLAGPIVSSNGSFIFEVSYPMEVNSTSIINGIRELRYNNLAGNNVTVNPPRVLCVQVNDGETFSNPSCISINVEFPNPFAPAFLNTSAMFVYNETDSPINVGYFIAVDNDVHAVSSMVFYSIHSVESFDSSGTKATESTDDLFKIDPSTGLLTIPRGLDAESYINHNVTIRARDNGNPNRYDYLNLFFTVLDVNDNAPQFINLPYNPTPSFVEEELTPFTQNRTLYTIFAVDDDLLSSNNIITFSLTNNNYLDQNGDQIFHIVESTGLLYYNRRLDREQADVFILNVSATDNGSPPLTSFVVIHFTAVDINDNAPTVDQLSPALFVKGQQPSSIGPAIYVTDPDSSIIVNSVDIAIENPTIDDYSTCLTGAPLSCQEERAATLNTSAINLMALANFSGDGVTDTTLGEAECAAKKFQRLGEDRYVDDGYGRISRSSLPSSFGSGEMSFSFVANITNEGFVVGMTDITNPNAPAGDANIVFGIWIRRRIVRLTFTDTNSNLQKVEYRVSANDLSSNSLFTNFFDPSPTDTYIPRHYIVTLKITGSTSTVSFYANCKRFATQSVGFTPAIPNPSADVFIARTIPGTISTDITKGHRHFGGDLHGLMYYPYALSDSQIASMCLCERLITPSDYSSSLSITHSISTTQPITQTIAIRSNDSSSLPSSEVNTFLREILYISALGNSSDNNRTLTFTTSDNTHNSISSGLILYIENDTNVPYIDFNGEKIYYTSFTEDNSPVSITGDTVTITRNNSANVLPTIQRITIELMNPGSTESLSGTGNSLVSLITNGTLLELVGPALPDNFIEAIKTITYNNLNQNPRMENRSISFTVYDTEGRVNNPLSYTEITIIPTNDSPELTLSPAVGDTTGTVDFVEDGDEVYLMETVQISDVDSNQFFRASASITNNFVAGSDTLQVNITGSGLTSTFNISTGVLIINGTGSLSEYNSALRSLSFYSTQDPSLDNIVNIQESLMRTVVVSVNDGIADSNTVSVNVEFMTRDDPTLLHINGSSVVTYIEGSAPVKILPNAYITDSDNTYASLLRVELATIGESGDVFNDDSITNTAVLSYPFTTITDLTTIIRGITFSNTLSEPALGNRTIRITLNDFVDNTQITEITVIVEDKNDIAPVFVNLPYAFSIRENSPIGTSVGQIEAFDGDRTPTEITFTLNSTSQFYLANVDSTTADILSNVTFNYETDSIVMLQVTASDGTLNATTQITIAIIDVNEAPVLSITRTSTAAAAQQSRPLLEAGSVTIYDDDIGDAITRATLTLSDVPASSNESLTLNASVVGYSFSYTVQDSNIIYTLVGAGEDLSDVLEDILYTAEDIISPLIVRHVTITVTDSGGFNSNPVVIEVTLADEPTFSPPEYSASLDENTIYTDFIQVQATVANPADTITYSTDYPGIYINSSTGYISLTQKLDYELTREFDFPVLAVAEIPLPRTATTTVYITVIDLNDIAPSYGNFTNITIPIGASTPGPLFDGVDIMDPDSHPIIRSIVKVYGDPLIPHPFSNKVCVDETNIITKMVSLCSLNNYINLLLYNDTGPGASISLDSYDNRIMTLNASYSIFNGNLTHFSGQINYLTLAFWFQPTPGQYGYIIYFASINHENRYFTVFYDSNKNQIEVTFKRAGVRGLVSQATVIFQMLESIEDGNWHFIVIQYKLRHLTLSIDGNLIRSTAVIYADMTVSSNELPLIDDIEGPAADNDDYVFVIGARFINCSEIDFDNNLSGKIAGAVLLPSAPPPDFASCVLQCLERMTVNTTGTSIRSTGFNESSRSLTLMGSAPVDTYEMVLHTITYINRAPYPNVHNITLTIDDGVQTSTQTFDVNIISSGSARKRRDITTKVFARRKLLSLESHQEQSKENEEEEELSYVSSHGASIWLMMSGCAIVASGVMIVLMVAFIRIRQAFAINETDY